MMQQLANFIVDHDPMMALRRTHDTVRYIRWAWNKDHADPIDAEELRLFLCDERRSNLTDEQRAFARQGRDKMRSVYSTAVLRMARCHYPPNRLVQLISHVDSSISLSTKYGAKAIP